MWKFPFPWAFVVSVPRNTQVLFTASLTMYVPGAFFSDTSPTILLTAPTLPGALRIAKPLGELGDGLDDWLQPLLLSSVGNKPRFCAPCPVAVPARARPMPATLITTAIAVTASLRCKFPPMCAIPRGGQVDLALNSTRRAAFLHRPARGVLSSADGTATWS